MGSQILNHLVQYMTRTDAMQGKAERACAGRLPPKSTPCLDADSIDSAMLGCQMLVCVSFPTEHCSGEPARLTRYRGARSVTIRAPLGFVVLLVAVITARSNFEVRTRHAELRGCPRWPPGSGYQKMPDMLSLSVASSAGGDCQDYGARFGRLARRGVGVDDGVLRAR